MIIRLRTAALFFLLTAILLLASCKGVDDISFKGVDNIVLQGIESNKINFSADVSIFNPSSSGFKISDVNLKTLIDGNFIGTLKITAPVKIKAKSDSAYHTNFSLELANIITGASTLYGLSRRKQVNLEMQGYVKARSWLVFKKVDVSEKQLIDVPSMDR